MAERRLIVIAAYDPAWPERFRLKARSLARVFAGVPCAIEHIGSTAVAGLAAKPVIDILLGVRELAEIEARIPAIESLGYVYVPEYEDELPERRFFRKDENGTRSHHVHAVQMGGAFWRRHLLFRDRLRASPETVAEYAALKKRIAERCRDDVEAYTNAKTDFIRRVLAGA